MAALLLISCVSLALIGDALLYIYGGYGATETAWIKGSRLISVIVAILIGCLIGHLYL